MGGGATSTEKNEDTAIMECKGNWDRDKGSSQIALFSCAMLEAKVVSVFSYGFI